MTGEKGGLLAGLRAEALKSRHAAPVRGCATTAR